MNDITLLVKDKSRGVHIKVIGRFKTKTVMIEQDDDGEIDVRVYNDA